MSAIHTLAKRRHGLIRTPRLRLRIADLLQLAPSTLQAVTDALLLLRHLRLLHILLLQLGVQLALLLALELLVRHGGELLRGYLPRQDALPELAVGLVLEVGEQGPDLLLVLCRLVVLEVRKHGVLHRHGPADDFAGGFAAEVRDAVIDEADARVAHLGFRALNVDAFGLVSARLGVARKGLLWCSAAAAATG